MERLLEPDANATILTRSGEYKPILDSPDPTGRTCTRLDLKTGTAIDFLAEGIRISDGIWLKGFPYSDPLPIPFATGFGDVASLLTLITMKVNCIKSGLETIRPRGEHRRLMI